MCIARHWCEFCVYIIVFFLMSPRPPSSTLFPYTTLFRSEVLVEMQEACARDMRCRVLGAPARRVRGIDRKSTRLNSSHTVISYAVFCLKKKKKHTREPAAD